MSIGLDHVFVITDAGAPVADLVVAAGLTEGASNIHAGQGTSNRRFFFQNTTLEFLYVHDFLETEDGPASGLRFKERSIDTGASPFGLIVKKADENSVIPFKGWQYCPDYFDSDICFYVGDNSGNVKEPLCICMPDNLPQRAQIPTPENSDWVLTELSISIPETTVSDPLLEIAKCNMINLQLNKPNCLELTFNHGNNGMQKDFRPDIPLIFNW